MFLSSKATCSTQTAAEHRKSPTAFLTAMVTLLNKSWTPKLFKTTTNKLLNASVRQHPTGVRVRSSLLETLAPTRIGTRSHLFGIFEPSVNFGVF